MITVIGLLLDIIGIIILFFFEPPKPSFGWQTNDAPSEEDEERSFKRKIKYSRIALIIIVIGFICQLIGALKQI